MKQKTLPLLLLVSSVFLLGSCGSNAASSPAGSSVSASSSAAASSSALASSSSASFSLADAFDNTTNYALKSVQGSSFVLEYLSSDIYYYYFNGGGLIRLKDDSTYAHEFTMKYVDLGDSLTHMQMEVHGIVNYAGIISQYNASHGFTSALSPYLDDFVKDSADPYLYHCDVVAMATTIRNYFQAQSLAYTNYFELRTNAKGKLDTFTAYEKTDGVASPVMSLAFVDETLDDFEPYQLWVKAGSVISMRIIDWKGVAATQSGTTFFYRGKSADIAGTITAIDAAGDVYLAAKDSTSGPIGIRAVRSKDDTTALKVGDSVTLSGTISSSGYEAFLNNATVKEKGTTSATVLPCFDEEGVSASYGNGAYAGHLFSQTPIYMDSLYSFDCYVKDLVADVTDKSYSTCTLVFPDYESGKTVMNLQLRIEKSLTNYASFMATLSAAKGYGESDQTKISIGSGLVQFGLVSSAFSYVSINLTDTSSVSKAQSNLEKAQAILGNTAFTLPEGASGATVLCYHVGPERDESVEAVYGLTDVKTNALKYSVAVDDATIASYQTELVNEGFALKEKLLAPGYTLGLTHNIYQNGNAIVDVSLQQGMSGYAMVLYLYQASTYIHGASFLESFATKTPTGFPISDYVKVSGTYEADYTYYELTHYAGNIYLKNKFLVSCISLHGDSLSDNTTYTNLIASYTAEGYATYKDDAGSKVTYRTRGVTHTLLEKNGIIVDLSLYPSSDYTFLGSDSFTDRIEVAIYAKENYKAPNFVTDADLLNAGIRLGYGTGFSVNLTLPTGSYYEGYLSDNDAALIDYGYGYGIDFFFYPGPNALPSDVIKALTSAFTSAGYTYQGLSNGGNSIYRKSLDSGAETYILIMPDKSKGIIRVVVGMGGTRF
jgi:hypothetical protein